ncbi:MAG: hypothetical protein E7100_03995 [Bacteroidaceae bacterium]|nr:hypothetical protein [Bacteroidaceae bacterium]
MKTLLKITGGLIGGIFILLLVALIAVNTDFVQNKALQYVTRHLSEKLQMPTKAKHININIFTLSAKLQGVDIELPKGKKNETFVAIEELTLKGKRVDIKGLRFRTENHKPRKNTNKPKRGWFDAGHIDFIADAQLQVNHIDKDSISASIVHLNATDSVSGFFIRDLSLDATTDFHQIHVRNASFQQENTFINIPGVDIWLPSKKKGIALSYYTTEPLTAHVILQDISHLFTKALAQFTIPLHLSVMVEGDADSMLFKDIDIKNEDERLHINANGGIENLRNKYLLNISFHVDEMLAKDDIAREIIDQFIVKKYMMHELSKLGEIHYKGDFSVLRKREVFSGTISTAAGEFNLSDLTLNDSTKYVSGRVSTPNLELGKVIDLKDIGKIAANASFEFDISKVRTAEMRAKKGGKLPIGAVEAKVKEANYNKIKVRNIDVGIISDGAIAEGILMINGKVAETSFTFTFEDTREMHKMKVKPKIKIHTPKVLRIFSKNKK